MSKKPVPNFAAGEPASAPSRWSFGEAQLDEARRELRVRGRPVELEPKPFSLLMLLLRRAGEAISKDELMQVLWAGRIVSESVLANCVNKLRLALGDERQEIIRTVHGYGYRLDAAVNPEGARSPELEEAPVQQPLPPAAASAAPMAVGGSARFRRLEMLRARPAVLLVGLVVLALGALWRMQQQAPVDPSIAVLPFQNLSPEPQANEYLASGMHDNILTHLARVQGLKVISRGSVMRYRGTAFNLHEVGRELGVAHVLEGSVQQAGNRVRLNAQLIEVATDRHLWAEIYDRDVGDLFALQSELAERVAESVGVRLTEDERSAIKRNPTESRDAYELYLRARAHERADAASQEHLFRAQALLERAVAEDPKFALAHAALARVHTLMYWFGYDPAVERREQARAAAQRALELNPTLPEAHMSLGFYRAGGFRDYLGALEAYRQALKWQPNSAEIHQRIGSAWRRLGRWKEALASYTRALELDPANTSLLQDAAYLYHGLRRYREAASLYERIVALSPDDIFAKVQQAQFLFDWKGDLAPMRELLGRLPADSDRDPMVTYMRFLLAMWEGRFAEAAPLLAAYPSDWMPSEGGRGRVPKEVSIGFAYELAGDRETAQGYYGRARRLLEAELRERPNDPDVQLALGQVLGGLGERAAALRAVRRSIDLMPPSVDPVTSTGIRIQAAMLYTQLGEHDKAIAELERLLNEPFGPSVHQLRVWPYWRALHAYPAFQALIAEHSGR